MIKLVSSLALAAAATSGVNATVSQTSARPSSVAPAVRLPGFAPLLADAPMVSGPGAWAAVPQAEAWHAIVTSDAAGRQAARWTYAVSLIAAGRGPDAVGVLDVMVADDPDLVLVPAWQRARGVALTLTRHYDDAITALSQGALLRDPETCLWAMRALAETDASRQALALVGCALPALNARRTRARVPFMLAVGRAGVAVGKYSEALTWLAHMPDSDPQANLLRGKAYLALGQAQEGRLRLDRARRAGTPEDVADAEITTLENGFATHATPLTEVTRRLDRLLIGWRRGTIEERALRLSMKLGDASANTARTMLAGAILSRYFDLGAEAAPLVQALQARIVAMLAPSSKLPLDQAAGLFWDYRDFAPSGVEGLRLVESLVDRLQAASLYGRAADLLQYRLTEATAQDVEKGPLSVRVASLRILGGDPMAAIRILRLTDDVVYPASMISDRRQVEAAALTLVGKTSEALATLDDVPDGAAIRGEIYWRARDWAHLEQLGEANLPPPGQLNEVGQAIVLRHAIALAMLGHEEALARLNARYATAFARLPTAPTFAMLTAKPGSVDPDALAKAMGALPSASPAGEIGELIDAGQAAMAEHPVS